LPATPTSVTTVRHAVAEFCAGQVLDHGAVALAVTEAVALAVTEAVALAVVHAYCDGEPGLVYVAASLDDGMLAVVISDDGKGMTPRTAAPGSASGLPSSPTSPTRGRSSTTAAVRDCSCASRAPPDHGPRRMTGGHPSAWAAGSSPARCRPGR
jgi:anti-sigma regulatory factor (Ser/Thr protein kinase)